jgi:dsDNA-specific endonuclease/ATPase MutS2
MEALISYTFFHDRYDGSNPSITKRKPVKYRSMDIFHGFFIFLFCDTLLKLQKRREIDTMNHTFEIVGFDYIKNLLQEASNTAQGKMKAEQLVPFLSETELRRNLRDTTHARQMLEDIGTPPIPCMEDIGEKLDKCMRGELLSPEELEQIGMFITAVQRMQSYLKKGKEKQIGLAYYSDNLVWHKQLGEDITRSIRYGKVDDHASPDLTDIRRKLQNLEQEIVDKTEKVMRNNRIYLADSFVVNRNGRSCIPVKKEYKSKVSGSVIDISATGATLFMEPSQTAMLREEYELLKIEEDCEERRIIYTLMNLVADCEMELSEDIRVIGMLDFVFAKGKLSMDLKAVEPSVNLERYIRVKQARHPMLPLNQCVPLDFEIGHGVSGVVITGPNTGGKTVAIKTVALLSLMACSGLHVPCEKADICMNSQVLCDIGDGQNIADNLSTFSSHIKNVLEILKQIDHDCLVVMDELGSGTDPTEGMGIAIAVLEELRQSNCLFLVTTHYPEVKDYANRYAEIENARMTFDQESLRPLYRLEIGKSGDSCALYIARRLGMPAKIIKMATMEAYGTIPEALYEELNLNEQDDSFEKIRMSRIRKVQEVKKEAVHGEEFHRGDSVMILPKQKVGIVVKAADQHGNVLVQIQNEKKLISHKRLKLKVAAMELYPEDYDFSIIFDTVENRKARHKMGKGHQENLEIHIDELE